MEKSKIYINENDRQLYERGITFCNLDIVVSIHMPEKTAIILDDNNIFSDQIIINWQDDEHFTYRIMENKFKYNYSPFLEKI